MNDLTVCYGVLGWSNKRSGLEFYRWDPKLIPRHGSEWGELLVETEHFPGAEGCPVLVIPLPRATPEEEVFLAGERALRGLAQ